MKPAKMIQFLFALVVAAVALGVRAAPGDELPADTSAIESLTPEQARRLAANFPGADVEITIMGSSKATFYRSLPLNGLKQLDADTAKALAGYGKEALILNGLTTIDADTARALAEFKVASGARLVLNGLTRLDAATARQLATFQGGWLGLSGLSSLDAETATALAESKSVLLDLSGLPTLDATIAQALAGFRGQMLVLNGLTTLDPTTAEALAKYGEKGNHLGLCSLTTLDAATAKSLVKSKAWQGDVRRLATLDAATAKALGKFKGHFLNLGVNALDFDAAEAIAEYRGMIGVSEEVIEKLVVDHPLSPRTALVYANLFNGVLPFLTAFDSPDSVTVAEALARYKGPLSLPNLNTLSAEAAASLASHTGDLSLGGLTTFDSPDYIRIATALATHKGPLAIPNLKRISPKTLSALIAKEDIQIPLIDTLELIREPDGSESDDFVIPEGFEQRQQ